MRAKAFEAGQSPRSRLQFRHSLIWFRNLIQIEQNSHSSPPSPTSFVHRFMESRRKWSLFENFPRQKREHDSLLCSNAPKSVSSPSEMYWTTRLTLQSSAMDRRRRIVDSDTSESISKRCYRTSVSLLGFDVVVSIWSRATLRLRRLHNNESMSFSRWNSGAPAGKRWSM